MSRNKTKLDKLKAGWRSWDQGEFELSDYLEGQEQIPEKPVNRSKVYRWDEKPMEKMEQRTEGLLEKLYKPLALLFSLFFMVTLLHTVDDLPPYGRAEIPAMNELSGRYIESAMEETGAVNYVAGVILDYRAFDTLGESHVLYAALTAVLILLLDDNKGDVRDSDRLFDFSQDAVIVNSARIMVPIIVFFGIYVVLNGHISPGGGFSGGAIIGAGLIFYCVAMGYERAHVLLSMKSLQTVAPAALCFYSLSKCYSFFCGANGLESGISSGTPGRIFSAGLILPLNITVGIVVSLTMYALYSLFRRGRV